MKRFFKSLGKDIVDTIRNLNFEESKDEEV